MSNRLWMLSGAGTGALLAACAVSAPALAQAGRPADDTGIQEIIVTAQRRETNLQTTAVSAASLSSSALEDRSIGDVEALGKLVPSMDVSIYQGEAQVYIRGIGYSGLIGGTDSSTALHLNGVYLSRSSAAVPGFLDAERVEVVRGPQGTLYGRNATGGSVNIIPKGPDSEWGGEASLIVGNYDRYSLFLAGGGPLAGDAFTFRAAVQMEDRDGYTRVTRPGGTHDRIEDKHDIAARLSIGIQPSERLEILLSGDYYRADDAATLWLYKGPGAANNPYLRAYIAERGGARPLPYSRDIESDVENINKPEIWGLSAKVTLDLDFMTVRSLTAYRRTRPYNFNDLDITSVHATTQLRVEDHDQWSHEFQFSSPGNRDLEWIFGLYYFQEKNNVRNEYDFPFVDGMLGLPPVPDCCLLKLNGTAKTKAYAAFGEVNYDLTDTLNVVLGGRYSSEKRSGGNAVEFVNVLNPFFDNIAAFDPKTFESFTPKAGVNFTPAEGIFLYASASRGFKSGGFNVGSYQNTPFDPEKIWAYEIGAKADLLDRHLRLNMAAFYYDYTDLQIQDVEGQNIVIRNAASAVVKGFELESVALPAPGLQVDFSFTYLDSKFQDTCLADPKNPLPAPQPGCTGPGERNLDGFQLPRAPKLKLAVGAQYEFDMGDRGRLVLRGDYAWQKRVYFSAFQVRDLSQKAYGWSKARLTYIAPGDDWRLAVYIDNITNEKVMSNATYIADIVDAPIFGVMAPPRTYGVQASINF